MRRSERVHPLCPMDNTHGILKRHAENALAACSTVLRTMGLQRGYHYVAGTRPRAFSFCCFRNNLRFQKFFRGTDGYKFLSSIFDEEGSLDQNSLELSSSANSSASLLAQVKNSSA